MTSLAGERKSSMSRRRSPNGDYLDGARPARPNSFTNLGHNLVSFFKKLIFNEKILSSFFFNLNYSKI